jgi:hypothetical protein
VTQSDLLQSQADTEDIKPALKKLQTDKGKGKAVEKDDTKEEKPVPVDIHSLDITPSTKMRRLWYVAGLCSLYPMTTC